MGYDPKHGLVLLAQGTGGDTGKALVYAMRYRHANARFVSAQAGWTRETDEATQ